MAHIIDKFGFWNYPESISFDIYDLEVNGDFEELRTRYIGAMRDDDGYIYLPVMHKYKLLSDGSKERVDNSRHISSMMKLKPSHTITSSQEISIDTFRKEEGAFIIALLAFLYKTQFQFEDWWHVGRFRLKQKPIAYINKTQVEEIMERALEKWRSLRQKNQIRIINALNVYQRGQSLEWRSDRFIYFYLAIDALWKIGTQNEEALWKSKARVPHKERISVMCSSLGLWNDAEAIKRLTSLRNSLFHEADFGVGILSFGVSGYKHEDTWALENLVQRIILGVLDLKPKFLSYEWENSRFNYNWEE